MSYGRHKPKGTLGDLLSLGTEENFAAAFDPFLARFKDRGVEAEYQRHMVEHQLGRDRLICYCLVAIYAFYGVLDILTISERLGDILIMRWLLMAPLALALILSTQIGRFKPFYASIFTFGVFLLGVSVVWMISILPAAGSPPYIIGVLTVFIFASCSISMPFAAAAAAFTLMGAAYSAVLLGQEKFSDIDVISGHFFMASAVLVAIVSNYTMEIRGRVIWRHNVRRYEDAQAIEKLMIEATASDQSKINFLSILSHELRTPLHQIIGFSEIVTRQAADLGGEEAQRFLGEINSAAHALLSRIGKMLRYADATAGKIKYALESYPAREIIDIVCGQMLTKAEAAGIRLIAELEDEGELYVDQASTTYALGHIVENAIKASSAGGRVAVRGRSGDGLAYVIEVDDRGRGMSEAQVRQAFAPFSQAESARTRSVEGVGLGLTLARKIFGDQGIDLSIASRPGEGTTVRITFPAHARAGTAAA